MLLDLPPSLCPAEHSPETSSCSNSIYNVNSRQYLAYADEEEEADVQSDGAKVPRKTRERRSIPPAKIFKRILDFRQVILIVMTPLLLSPLLLSNEQEFKCAFCVALMAIYWTGEVMPLAATALLPVVLFPMAGIMSAKDVSKEFLNDTNFLFIGGLIVATAVEKCGLHERLALAVLSVAGSEPKRIALGFMSITALLSMFISNTATTAMMLPIGQSVVELLAKSENNNQQQQKSSIESGCPLLDQSSGSKQRNNHRMAKGLILSIAFAANIGGVGTLTGTPPNLVLVGMLSSLFPRVNTGVNYLSWMALTMPLMLVCLLLCWILLSAIFMRNSPPDQQISILLRKKSRELPPMSFAEKSVALSFLILLFLWIGRNPGFMPGIGDIFPHDFYTDSTSAMIIAILLFLLPAENPFTKQSAEPNKDSQKRLMDWPTMQRHFPWSVVLLLGGGFALAAGVRESGLSTLMGQALGQLEQQPVWTLQLICIGVTMFVTNICSNTVTASIFIPIVSSMAQRSAIHPLALMLPTTLACSFAFMLPVGSPPNAIAFSSGMLSVSDMVFSGLAISIATSLAMIAYLAGVAPLLMPIDRFPVWASLNGTTGHVELQAIPEPIF